MSRPPRLEARIPYVGQELRFKANFDATWRPVVIPDGYYYCLGQHGRVENGGEGGAQLAEGHGIAQGDRVVIWSVATNTALAEDANAYFVDGGEIEFEPAVIVEPGDRFYHADDILGALEARLAGASVANNSQDIRVSMDQNTGIVTAAMESGFGAVWFSDGATFSAETLLKRMRWPGGTGLPKAGERCHDGGFFPTRSSVEERAPRRAERAAYRSDAGSTRVFHIAQTERLLLRLRFGGEWRAEELTERDDYEDLWDWASRGYRLRYYPDRSILEPWSDAPAHSSEGTRRAWGWQEWIMLGPDESDPSEVTNGSKDLWDELLELALWVG